MKNVLKLIATIVISFSLFGCGEMFPSDGRFVVIEVTSWGDKIYKFRLKPIVGNNGNIWYLKDSANKYIVGDTIIISKLK